jgi:hypothetical protein
VLVEDLLDLARVDVVAARMIMSFLRSMMYRYPSSSARATSPVWNQPPRMTSAVASSRPQ